MPIETGSTTKLSASADDYRDALRAVIDPEIFQNIVDLGLVYAVKVVPLLGEEQVAGDAVTVTMTLTSPHCPLGPQIMEDVEQTLYNKGAATVTIDLVWQPMWTPEAMTDELKAELGIFEQEAEPELKIELPPPPPKKKGWLHRLFGG
ncbi:MAG: metal-sulfur cluster assembly factor [Caldilineaceae bacterium]|nr:metal-sulfur cluster assembly factor [Caldilineaceae bacterium]